MSKRHKIGVSLAMAMLALVAAVPQTARAQSQTTVTATVTDPGSIPYAGGTVKAQIQPSGPPSPCVVTGANCVPIQGTAGPATLDPTGSFTMNLYPNSIITPAATQWVFTVCIAPGVPPPQGTGPQCFSSTQTISGASQSLSAALSALAPALTHGGGANAALKPGAGDGIQYVSAAGNDSNDGLSWGSAKATCTAATTAAGATGVVFISSNVSLSQVCSNPSNVPIIDYRPRGAGALGLWHGIDCGMSVTGLPLGNDCPVTAHGSADIRFTNQKVATTTTASIAVGSNPSVLVGSTTGFGTGSSAGLIIGRGSTNEDVIIGGNWSVVDGTHFSITATKTHSGTTDIEQIGTFVLDGRAIVFNGGQAPSQNPGAPYPFFDLNLAPILFMPRNTEQGGNIEQNLMLASPVHLVFLNSNTLPPTSWEDVFPNPSGILQNNNPSAFPLGFLGPFTSFSANPASTGMLKLASTDAIAWRNTANTGDIIISKNTGDQIVVPSLADSALTAGNCVQAGTGGLLTSAAAACGSGGSGLSGMTAGQIPVAATATTVTSSIAKQGTDTSLLSSGTVSGTSVLLCTDATGGATTVSCPTGSVSAPFVSAVIGGTATAGNSTLTNFTWLFGLSAGTNPTINFGNNLVTFNTPIQASTLTLTNQFSMVLGDGTANRGFVWAKSGSGVSNTTPGYFEASSSPTDAFNSFLFPCLSTGRWCLSATTPAADSSATIAVHGPVNPQIGTSYAIADTDEDGLTTLNNAAAIAVTLACPSGTSFQNGWKDDLQMTGAGTPTVTVSGCTINGATTLTVPTTGVHLVSDGTNYRAIFNASGGGVSSVSNSDGTLTVSPTTGAVVASLALGHANTWTGIQTFPAASLTNAELVNSSTTPNGVICTLGLPCNVGSLFDTNGNATVSSAATAAAVDQITVTNGATGAPGIVSAAATGTDANITLDLLPKGTGILDMSNAGARSTSLTIGPTVSSTANLNGVNTIIGAAGGTGSLSQHGGTTSALLCWENNTGSLNEDCFNNSGVLITYGHVNTAGQGTTPILGVSDLTAQTASIASTTLYTTAASGNYSSGEYHLVGSLVCTVGQATTTVVVTMTWNNGTTAQSFSAVPLNSTTLITTLPCTTTGTEYDFDTPLFSGASQAIAISTTAANFTTGSYQIHMRVDGN